MSDKLVVLSLPLPTGRASSAKVEQGSGKTHELESNHLKLESVAITFGDDRSTLIVRDEHGGHALQIGYATWLKANADLCGQGDELVAACGAWTAHDAYEFRACSYESEFCLVYRFHYYTSGELQLEVEPNISWGFITATTITGRAAG